MKQELLEYLIRHCVCEVLRQTNNVGESKHRDGEGNVYDNSPKDYDNKKVVCEKEPISTGGNGKGFQPMGRFEPTGKYAENTVAEETKGSSDTTDTNKYFNREKRTTSRNEIERYVDGGFPKKVSDRQPAYRASGKGRSVNEGDPEIKGAPAPPADGQGTADQPEIPKDKDTTPEKPSEPETPDPAPTLKGIIMVDPRDKSRLDVQKIQGGNDAALERELYRIAASKAGPSTKVALATARMVKGALSNPNAVVYLYLGKYDPDSQEVFLMADKSLQIAKDQSISPSELMGTPTSVPAPTQFDPTLATAGQFAKRMQSGGQTQVPRVDEKLVKVIRKMVNEMLDKK